MTEQSKSDIKPNWSPGSPPTVNPPSVRSTIAAPAIRARVPAWLGLALVPLMFGCSVASRLDYRHPLDRRGWQLTDRVIEQLNIRPGDTIADLGAGDGYFSLAFAEVVGPTGRIYAVDIDTASLDALRDEIRARGITNVEVIEASPEDPGLPAGAVDLVFFCNAYHHFGDRVAYMRRLHTDLAPDARIAIVDGRSGGAAQIFLPKGHSLPPGQLEDEMRQAHFSLQESHDFLPLQTFDVFRPTESSSSDPRP